jgi:type I restriction enzyme S subunit
VTIAKYTENYDSGLAWLGAVPKHWSLKRLGHFFSERREKVSDKEFLPLSVTKHGIVPRLETAAKTQDGDNRKRVIAGDFVINSRSDRKGSSGLSELNGSVSLICIVLEPDGVYGRFAHHLLRSEVFQEEFYRNGKGIVADLWSTGFSEMKNIVIPVPSQHEQTQIARFLDHETAKIDALIREQERLIELLQEKRQSVISHAVTKGLDPDVPMKDSGVEWLGDVPEHWRVVQVRHLIRKIEQGKSPECESRVAVGEEWGVLKSGCVNGGIYRSSEHKALPVHISPHSEYEVKEGDVLMSRASGSKDLIGAVAYVEETPSRLLLSDKVFRLKLEPGVHQQHFTLLMGSQHVRAQIELAINGAEGLANNITKDSIKSFVVALPEYKEQQDIFAHLSTQALRFARLSEQLLAALDVLKERRSTLISAAVTGKIDVRDWQPPTDESAFGEEVRRAGLEATA